VMLSTVGAVAHSERPTAQGRRSSASNGTMPFVRMNAMTNSIPF
jgi:hypothetical protein